MNFYSRYLRTILSSTGLGNPRGLPTRYLVNRTFSVPAGTTYRRDHDNPLIGFMEGLQFIAGAGTVEQIARVAPRANLDLFSDQSLYGPRAGDQTQAVIEELCVDRDSRRAVIVLASPNEPLTERPCTTSLQFQIVDGGLITTATMRSSDAIYGLPYDLTQFGMMAQIVARCTGSLTADLIVNIGNAHIYNSTAHLAVKHLPWSFQLPNVGNYYSDWCDWARSEIKELSMSRAQQLYDFKRVPRERA